MEPSISDKEFKQRIDKTRKKMKSEGIGCLLVFSSYPEREGHIEYLTNYHGAFPPSQHDVTYRGLGYSALALSQSKGPVLFTGMLFAAGRLVGVERIDSSPNLPLAVSNFILKEFTEKNDENRRTVGIAGSDVLPALYLGEIEKKGHTGDERIKFISADKILAEQRQIKSTSELRVLRKGAELADAAIEAAFNACASGVRESEVGLAAANSCYERGADYVARTRIYGRGISGVRWPIMTNRKLQRGEITGIDLVGFYKSYGFDVLRVWTVGNPTSAQKESLRQAATLTEETAKRTRAGMNGDDVCKMTMEVARQLELELDAVSPFGHGIGLEIVENPLLFPQSVVKIKPGSFLCIEPGIELKTHQSIHFEDEVLIGENGKSEVVSKCRKSFY